MRWRAEALAAGADFSVRSCRAARLARRVGGIPGALEFSFLVVVTVHGWSAGRNGLQAGYRGGDVRGPGPVLCEA